MQSVKINPTLIFDLQNNSAFNFYGLFVSMELVSCLLAFSDQGCTGLYFIGTKHGFRGKGLAENLIRYVMRVISEQKTGKVILQAVQKAVPLYSRLGFSPQGKLIIFWKQ